MTGWLFGICMLLSWGMTASHLLAGGAMIYTDGPLRASQRPGVPRLLLLVAGTAVVGWSAWAFATTFAALPGVVFVVVLGVFRQWEKSQWTGDEVVSLGKYVPTAAVLTTFLVGRELAALAGAVDPTAIGWHAGAGAMGATFSLAALSKWDKAGSEWLQGAGVQLLISERALLVRGPLRRLRAWFGGKAGLCTALTAGAFGIEALGILYCVPELRWPFTVAAGSMLTGFWVLLGYWEFEWALVLLTLTLLSTG